MKRAGLVLATIVLVAPGHGFSEQILIRKDGKLVPFAVPDSKESDFIFAGTPTIQFVPIDPDSRTAVTPRPLAVDPNAIYSNVSRFWLYYVPNGGATNLSGNTITKLVADDLTITAAPPHPGDPLRVIRFVAHNNGFTAVTARPRISLFLDNAGVPGTFLANYVVTPLAFDAAGATFVSFNVPALFAPILPAGLKLWVGITFDDNGGGTGASAAQLNDLGLWCYGPPDVGTSTDTLFITTSAGAFLASDPPGATTNFAGVTGHPPANLGWEFATPVELQSFTAE